VHAVGADWELGGKWGRLMALSLCLSLTHLHASTVAAGGGDTGGGEWGWMLGRRVYVSLFDIQTGFTPYTLFSLHALVLRCFLYLLL
jgi:hypothetical protein